SLCSFSVSFFFFNDTATTVIYTLSLHDALPISVVDAVTITSDTIDYVFKHFGREFKEKDRPSKSLTPASLTFGEKKLSEEDLPPDRKSTRLNSSHVSISYAVFCLKKKNKNNNKT